MKKILLVLMFICMTINANSQDHIKFMNIPIDGHAEKFVKKLKKKGFKNNDNKDKYFLEGKFTSEDVYVHIVKTPKTQTVCAVLIYYYKTLNDWDSLKQKFDNLVHQFSLKYDNPEILTKSFKEPFTEGDGNEINALIAGKVSFEAKYTINHGMINISLLNTRTPMLSYSDKANIKLYLQEEQELVQEDI